MSEPAWQAERLGPADGETLIVVIHGGFWRARVTADSIRPLAASLAGAGRFVWNIEYPRVGMTGGGWPGTAHAVGQAIDTALIEAGERPVVVLGHSAGGQLALWAARGRPVQGVLALAALLDLQSAARTGLGEGAVEELLDAGPDAAPDRYEEASPLSRLPLGVEAVLVHGEADTRVPPRQSRDYTLAARAAGDRVTLLEPAGVDHMQLIDPIGPARPLIDEHLDRLASAEREL